MRCSFLRFFFAHLALAGVLLATARTHAQTSVITYQGSMQSAGFPVDAVVDMQFRLFDEEENGLQVGPDLVIADVAVNAGLFTVDLDFGVPPYVANSRRWLELAVRRPGDTDFTRLSPRQFLASTPFSMNTRGLFVDQSGRVGVGNSSPAYRLDVLGDFRAGGRVLADASNFAQNELRGANSMWQSFTALNSGRLRSVTFKAQSTSPWQGTMRIYVGTGTSGTPLTGSIAMSGPGSPNVQTITVNIPTDAPVFLGQVYTFETVGPGTFVPLISTGNAYAGGQASTGSTIDMYFETSVAITGLIVTDGGRVGIGTSTPASELEVRGNVRLGTGGDLLAPGAPESLRIVRGNVSANGVAVSGSGFNASPSFDGAIMVTFTTPFPAADGAPSVIVTPESPRIFWVQGASNTGFTVDFETTSGFSAPASFSFVVMGKR